jgi:hypothetical protein
MRTHRIVALHASAARHRLKAKVGEHRASYGGRRDVSVKDAHSNHVQRRLLPGVTEHPPAALVLSGESFRLSSSSAYGATIIVA